ncbi:MAG: hypothetical protein ACFFCS_09290 [Candidatus Hodarchaeota archaeon]
MSTKAEKTEFFGKIPDESGLTEGEKEYKEFKSINLEARNDLFKGLVGLAIMYAMVGLLMIVIARIIVTMPLNTDGVFSSIGRMHSVYETRYLSSSVFFGISAATILIGFYYTKQPGKMRWPARILAFVHQAWVPLIFLIVGAIWGYLAMDSRGDVAEFIADTFYDIDVTTSEGETEFNYLMAGMPSFSFLMIGIGGLIISPFSSYSAEILLQDTGVIMNAARKPRKKRGAKIMSFERKSNSWVGRGLVNAGILYCVIGAAIWGIGFALGAGIDITYPLSTLSNYPLYMNVYLWIPIAFGAFCIITGILYYNNPEKAPFRIMTWATVFVQIIIPVIGWFYATIVGRDLLVTGRKEGMQVKKQILIGLLLAVAMVVVSLLIIGMFWLGILQL